MVTTEVRVHTTPPSTPAQLITSVTFPDPAFLPIHPWHSDEHAMTSPLSAATTAVPFTTISSVSSRTTRKKPRWTACQWVWEPWNRFVAKLRHLDPVKLAYLRTSFVFAISVLVTWTPSSINRVYTLVNPYGTNYGLNLASAIVLPLQGVWNCFIFCATSWNVLREEWDDALRRRGWPRRGSERLNGEDQFDRWGRVRGRGIERDADMEMSPPRMGIMRVIKGGSF